MQRAAIAIPIAFVMLAASAAVPITPIANVVQGSDASAIPPADTGSTNATGPAVAAVQEQADDEPAPFPPASMEEVCATLHAVAMTHELPLPFFARLIWQESRFRSEAVSRAGARGIAQFMPATASERGLLDPHDPIQALRHSAELLRALRNQFGNLGLAAAAYNGGPGRVQAWLAGRRKSLPNETRQYVQIITGAPVDEWKDFDSAAPVQTSRIPARIPCPVLVAAAAQQEPAAMLEAADVPARGSRRASRPSLPSWSVVLAGSFSKDRAEAQSARLQRRFGAVLDGRMPTIVSRRIVGRGKSRLSQVSIPEADRASAERLCAKLRASGASCAVLRAS